MAIQNVSAGPLVITGDEGVPSIIIARSATATVALTQFVNNSQFCEQLAGYITSGEVIATVNGVVQTAERVQKYRDGIMVTITYGGGYSY